MSSLSRRSLAALALCASVSALPFAAQAQDDKVRVGLLSLVSHAPSIIADERGYFTEEGLEVELIMFQAAQPMAVAIAAGDVDFGITAITGGLISLSEKGAVKVIGGALHEVPGIEGQKYIVSNAAHDAGLTDLSGAAGKRFGVTTPGSSFHYMASKAAECGGADPSDIQVVPLNAVPAVAAALTTNQVDAWGVVPNLADPLVEAGNAVEIGRVADCIPGYQVTTVFTSSRRIQDNPDSVRNFLAAFSKGVEDYNAALVARSTDDADRAEVVAMIHKYVHTDTPADEVAARIEVGAMEIAPGAALNVASVEDQLNWFQSEGLVPESITMDMLVDSQFVESN